MEQRYIHSVDGQAFDQGELNMMAEEAARADDRVLAELFRFRPRTSLQLEKRILPYRIEGYYNDGGNPPGVYQTSALVFPNAATGSVLVNPFRAFIGPITNVAGGAWYEARSGRAIGSVTPYYGTVVQLDDTVSNHRWDLIYARVAVDIPTAGENRVVRTISGVTTQSIPLYTNTLVTLDVANGTEGASPSYPLLPTDGDPSEYYYYIPLAYVLLEHPFNSSSVVPRENICEVAPVARLASSTGAVTAGPTMFSYADHSPLWTQRGWDPSTGRPQEFLPSVMAGGAMRFIALDMSDVTKSLAQNTVTIIDDSMDWSHRLIWFIVYAMRNTGATDFAWMASEDPLIQLEPQGRQISVTGTPSNQTAIFVGNTFNQTVPALVLDSEWTFWGAGQHADLEISTDTSGRLTARYVYSDTDLDMKFVILAIASSQYQNAK